ncbi:uncharacterized protein LOC129571322 [Sitodiplosis mosellana]|uniref:uncharacterized protein LOC129571322 n=1 Tax=Sitodiplosis mosellana TaxID=263140 RepID=UPI002444352D|nr:uncharacterized protein LOC129571322 [Sitodiplosis mosellana]
MPKIKRESRQFIVINEEKLISEVEKRSILYDKALKGYRKPAIRETAWQEVAVALESTVDECKKRWRSLRDAFMKQYKLYSRGDTNSKKRWLFYEQMEFLGPYFDNNDDKYDGDDYIETINTDGESIDKNSLNQIVCINSDGEYPTQIEVDEYNEEQLEEDALDTTQYTTVTSKKGENSVYYISAPTSHSSINNDSQLQSPTRQQTKVLTQTNTNTSNNNDPDERFLLSCLPILKRLPNKKNALARLRIQQLLFEIEFEDYEVSGQ